MASLVNDKRADLTLEALSAKAPDEVLAVAAEGGLLEEARYELVLLDLDDKLLAQSTTPRELLELGVVLRVPVLVAVVRELAVERVVVAVGRVGVSGRADGLEGRRLEHGVIHAVRI